MTLRGIDISGHQAGIDLSRIDCDFVIVKATGGEGFVNPDFRRQADQALATGKLLGLYHYAWDAGYKGSARGEAVHFLSHVADYIGRAVLCLDWEGEALEQLSISWAKEWMDIVAAETGANPWFYSGASFVNGSDCSAISQRPLWMASYLNRYAGSGFVDDPQLTWGSGSFPRVTCYQYTSEGVVPGYGARLDLDCFYGVRNDFESGYRKGEPSGTDIIEYTHRVEDMVNYAIAYAADDSHGYTQDMYGRWGQDRDCATMMYDCATHAGFPVGWGPGETRWTGTMVDHFSAAGFAVLPYGDPQRGDILLADGHTEMYIGDGMTVGAHCSETGGKYGVPGDQTGNEVSVAPSASAWHTILRPPAEIPILKEDDLKPISNKGGKAYRLYNPYSGDHLWTVDADEKEFLRKAGWEYEGIGFQVKPGGIAPVFRMYNPNSGDHHWTADYDEACTMQKAGWRYEGVPWFGETKGTAVYRLYNPNSGDHMLTVDAKERDGLKKAGWNDEKIAFYI